jgi:ATP dependent DNA ligase domain
MGKQVPDTPSWIHEIKFDGFRIRVVRDDAKVRLFTTNGQDWTDRYPWIVEATRKIKASRFIMDGEAVVLDLRSYSDFDALVSRKHDHEVQLYAFDPGAQWWRPHQAAAEHAKDQPPAIAPSPTLRRPARLPMSRARLGQIFSVPPASTALRASSRRGFIVSTTTAGVSTG